MTTFLSPREAEAMRTALGLEGPIDNLTRVPAGSSTAVVIAKLNALLTEMKATGVMDVDLLPYGDMVLDMAGLVSFWRLGEPSGATAYDDVSDVPVRDDYTAKGTRPLTTPDIGPEGWTLIETGGAEARLSIINGKLTWTANDPAVRAGYAWLDLGVNVRRMGGRFTLDRRLNPGVAGPAFAIWNADLDNLDVLPDSPCHLHVTDTGWVFSVIDSPTFSTLASSGFAVPLATDGVTVHRVSVDIYGTNARIELPDGTTALVTDARIGSFAGSRASFEVFAPNAATDGGAAFTEVWADGVTGNNDGAYVGAPTRGVAGPIPFQGNTAVTFASGASVTADAGPAGVNDYSIVFWVKRNDAADVHLFYGTGAAGGWVYAVIETALDRIHIGHTTNAGAYSDHYSEATVFDDTDWHHVALVRTGTTFRIGIDGAVRAMSGTTGPGPIDLTTFRISSQLFAGGVSTESLDEFALFNRAVTDEEIAALYHTGS